MKRGYVFDVERVGIRESFDEKRGTLNGRPATVLGRLNDFATVHAMDGSGLHVEISWQALRRIVKADHPNVLVS